MRAFFKCGVCVAGLLASQCPQVVFAQDTGQTRVSEAAKSEGEIVVTASRQASSLQDTALNINVLSSEKLEAAGLTNSSDLQHAVPSLQYTSSGGTSFIYLRGIGSNIYGGFSSNSIATYVDGIYVPSKDSAVQEFLDVERVEVLRGPQATLYGRNATGGAILLNTGKPTDHFTASVDAEYGNYDAKRIRGMISGPIIGDTVKARLAVIRNVRDGYSVNLTTGNRFDSNDFWGVRGTLLIEPSPTFSITLRGNYSRQNGSPGGLKSIAPSILNSPGFENVPFPPFFPIFWNASRFTSDPRAEYRSIDDQTPSESYGASARIEADLGFAKLVSNSAYQGLETGPTFQDLDNSEVGYRGYLGTFAKDSFYFQDMTLSSATKDSPLQWLLGATYMKEGSNSGGLFQTLFGAFPTPSFAGDTSYSVYGQASYDISSKLRLLTGLRYSSETRKGVQNDRLGNPVTKEVTWTDVSPKFSIEFRPSDNLLAYASATKGFKSGVFDPRDFNNVGNPETIWNYEVGLKTSALNGRLSLSANAFYYDYRDLQVFSGRLVNGQIVPLVQNAGRASVKGFEAEANFKVSEIFTIGGTIGILDAKYGAGSIQADTTKPGNPLININGFRMTLAPTFSGTAFVEAKIPMRDESSLDFHADIFYQSSRYFTAFQDPTLSARGNSIVNARVTYNLPGDKVYIGAYIRNAADTLVASTALRVLPLGVAESYAAPRTYGVQAGFRF